MRTQIEFNVIILQKSLKTLIHIIKKEKKTRFAGY
jgi:hypothetical protein